MGLSEPLTIEPRSMGAYFHRGHVRRLGSNPDLDWYITAATRYIGNLARKRQWAWADLGIEVQRRPDYRDWEVRFFWRAIEVRGEGGMFRHFVTVSS
jgi:hypothetical protein